MTINIQGYLSILTDYPEDSVLVLREVNLPRWSVTINDEPAQLESVGGYIGLQLTDDIPVTVRFSYTSRWFYLGAGISLASILLSLG